jgi:arylsulfatase
VQDGRLHSVHNFMGRAEYHLEADAPLPTGQPCTATFEFTRTGEHAGDGRLLVDGGVVAAGPIPQTVPRRFGVGSGSLRVGDDPGISVTARYEPPFPFSGRLHRVIIEASGPEDIDPAAEARIAIQSQ